MDLDAAIARYTAHPDVARWLFSTDEITTVTAGALDNSFVYAIGFGVYDAGTPRTMNIEDMLIVTGRAGNFVLGLVWGLSQPHVFARTPLMLDKQPVARRFAVDFSSRDALEFMEFVSFDDGKVIVMFRQFLHTHDLSLPVVACARLHAASQIEQTLGPVLMRADLFEAPRCPACNLVGRQCQCSFSSYAPNGAVRKATYTWNEYASRFMHKARVGTIKLRMTAVLPNVGEMRIMDDDMPVVNVMQRGQTEYMGLLRRKAVHGLGINVIMPRSESFVLSTSVENDFIDMHNSYVSRKRIRDSQEEDPSSILLEPATLDLTAPTELPVQGSPSGPSYSDSIESVDDVLSIFPSMLSSGESPRHPDDTALKKTLLVGKPPTPPVPLPQPPEAFQPFGKMEPFMPPNGSSSPVNNTATTQGLAQQTSPTQTDILKDIELILSPPGPQTDPHLGIVKPPTPPEPPLDLLSMPQGADLVNGKAPLQWAASVTSEHSTRLVIEPQQLDHSNSTSTKRKKTAKRSKPCSAGDGAQDGEKKHGCTKCSSRFKMRGDLLRHVKIVHEGKKMYSCETCGKAFGHSGHLNRHVQSVHLQKRRFKCHICGFQFFQQSHLQSHIGHIHRAKKPFSCKHCGYVAPSNNALKTHMEELNCGPARNSGPVPPANPMQEQPTDIGNAFGLDADLAMQMFAAQPNAPNFALEAPMAPLLR